MKQKGFTLVELLAVIVILAIIALIATPIIMNVVESSRKSSATSSAYGYIKGINITYANELLLGNDFELDGTLLVDENGLLDGHKIDVEGTTAKGGYLIYKDSKITQGCLTIGDYKVNIENDEVKTSEKGTCGEVPYVFGGVLVSKTENDTHKGIVYLDPTDLTKKCNSSLATQNVNEYGTPTGIKTGCMKWYIYDDEGDKYKMILDHNTTPIVPWNSTGSNTEMKEIREALDSDVSNWDSRIKSSARLITANEIAKITGNIDWNSETATNTNWFYLDSNSVNGICYDEKNNPICKGGESNYTWLFDYTQGCIGYGCSIEDNNKYFKYNSESLVTMGGYKTSDAVFETSDRVWGISRVGYLGYDVANNDAYYGLRPVIEIDKSLIQ